MAASGRRSWSWEPTSPCERRSSPRSLVCVPVPKYVSSQPQLGPCPPRKLRSLLVSESHCSQTTLTLRYFSPAVTWFASDHAAGEIDGLDAMRRAVTVCLEHPQKINVASREIELTVYEYRGKSLCADVGLELNVARRHVLDTAPDEGTHGKPPWLRHRC